MTLTLMTWLIVIELLGINLIDNLPIKNTVITQDLMLAYLESCRFAQTAIIYFLFSS
jgi:hypothetical protein